MKIALISDVHANLGALQATLDDIHRQRIETIYFLGDAVGYGCQPNACVELIDQACEVKLLGNHDFAAMGLQSLLYFNEAARRSLDWTQTELSDSSRAKLAEFELEHFTDELHLVHASPRSPDLWEYILTAQDAREQFDCFDKHVLFVGHSHVPMLFALREGGMISQRSVTETELDPDTRYIINVGSVGQPRDKDPRACYVTLDLDTWIIRYHRVQYDVSKTVSAMEKAGMPSALTERLLVGR